MDTELDERKRKILKAIIQTYLETGEPVGSRTISKYTDLNLSSATIRNEMSDLEEMGYILQPHTSAGRIPSDKGYRLYVDELMREKEQEVADIKNMVIEKTDRMEKVLQQVVKVLASSTNYATLITGPEYHRNKVKFIQLSKVNEEQLLAVIVVEGNLVKNQMIDLDETINDEQILKLNLLLNTQLNGLTIEEINLGMIKKMKEQAGIHSGIISKVVDTVAEAIAVSEEDVPVYTSGATNIFKYPELSDSSKASQLISTFEERQKLVDMIKPINCNTASSGEPASISIGDCLAGFRTGSTGSAGCQFSASTTSCPQHTIWAFRLLIRPFVPSDDESETRPGTAITVR